MARRPTRIAATAELKAALKKDRDNVEANTILGLTLFDLIEYEEAKSKLEHALSLGAAPSLLTAKLAQVLLSLNEFDRLDALTLDGLNSQDRSTVQAAKALSMIYRGNMPIAVELMAAARQNKAVSPFAEVAEARLVMDTQGYLRARDLLGDLLERLPAYVPAWRLLGDVESYLRQPAAAMQAYKKAEELSQNHTMDTALNGLLMRIYTGNYRRALAELKLSEARHPSMSRNEGLRFMRGMLELQREPPKEARKRLMKVESLIDYPLTLYYLAALDLEEGAPEFALSHVNQYLRYVPAGSAGLKLAAKIELSLGEYARAEYLMHRLLRRYPEDEEALAIYAQSQSRQEKYHEEIDTLIRLLSLQSDSHVVRARLALAYLSLGDENIDPANIPESSYLSPLKYEPVDNREVRLADQEGARSAVAIESDVKTSRDSSWRAFVAAMPGKKKSPAIHYVTAEQVGSAILDHILSEYPGYEAADILLVLNHLRHGRAAEAVVAAEGFLDRSPSSATAYDLLGRALLINGQNQAARSAFDNALALRPGYPDAARQLADFERAVGNIDASREYYEEILGYYPQNTLTGLLLAGTYAEQGMTMAMLVALEEARLANIRAPGPYLAQLRYKLALGDVEEASLLVNGMTEVQRSDLNSLTTIAAWEIARGRYDQALVNLLRLIQEQPDIAQYHYMRAKTYAYLGDHKRMLSELERTIELDPSHFFATIVAARYALTQGDMEAFQRLLEMLKAMAPENIDVMKLRSVSADIRGDSDVAQSLREIIVRRQPSTENVVALADYLQRDGNSQSAVKYLSTWLEQQGDDVVAREKLAEIYMRENKLKEAEVEYRRILRRVPAHVAGLNNLAWLMLEDDPETAIEYAKNALRFSGGASTVLDTLAVAHLKNDQLFEAKRFIERALSLSPNNRSMRFHQAQIMYAAGNSRGAIHALEALLADKAEFPQRQEIRRYLDALE